MADETGPKGWGSAKADTGMAVREILGAENLSLRRKARRIRRFDHSLEPIIADMVETVRASRGVGLAAPQIGIPLRIIVVELPQKEEEPTSGKLYVLLNPEIVSSSGEEEGEEGCLCLPGYAGEVKRATHITVKAQDREGKEVRLKAEGYFARVLQHEIDHLNGFIFVDRLESLDKLYRLEPKETDSGGPRA